MTTAFILASGRPGQVLAAAEMCREEGFDIVIAAPRPSADRFEGGDPPVVVLPIDRFAPPAPPVLAPGEEDLVVACINNDLGRDSDELLSFLLSAGGRPFLFTFGGELLPFGPAMRMRARISRFFR